MLTHMAHICAHIQSSSKHVLDTPDLVPVSTEYQPVRLSEGVGGTNDQGTGSGDSLGLLQADLLRSKPRLCGEAGRTQTAQWSRCAVSVLMSP